MLEEEISKLFGTKSLNDEHDCNVVSTNSLNIHDSNDMQSYKLALQKKYSSVMIRVCHSRSRFLSCMYIHDKYRQNQDTHTCAVTEVFHDITKIIITEVSTTMTINRASQKCFRQG